MRKLFLLSGVVCLLVIVTVVTAVVGFAWHKFRTPLATHVELSDKINPADFNLELQPHTIISLDGTHLRGYSATSPEDKGWVLLVHGFTPNGWKSMLRVGDFLHKQGFNVFFISLRSYGESEGNHIYLGTREWQDVIAAHRYIQENLNQARRPITWYGVSMGAASTLVAAGQINSAELPSLVIAQVPYITIQSLLVTQIQEEKLPLFIFRPLAEVIPTLELGENYRFYTPLLQLKNITTPLVVIGAERDNQVQFSDSHYLYENVATPVEFTYYYQLNTGHDVYSERPEDVQNILLDHIPYEELVQQSK